MSATDTHRSKAAAEQVKKFSSIGLIKVDKSGKGPMSPPKMCLSGLLFETRKELLNFVPDRGEEYHLSSTFDRIYEAFVPGDPDAAGEAVRQHLLTALNLARNELFLKRNEP